MLNTTVIASQSPLTFLSSLRYSFLKFPITQINDYPIELPQNHIKAILILQHVS
jgi:hypothetical protein